MNSKQAKELNLVEFLRCLGHEPKTTRGNDTWFHSPLRPEERTPSFKVDTRKNVWFDFGLGEGGTIIDLVQHYQQTSDISKVLAFIERTNGRVGGLTRSSTSSTRSNEPEPPRAVIESVSDISDRALEAYLTRRAIPLDLAKLYLREVTYRVDEHAFLALGFKNDTGGFELRSPTWKGSIGTKGITSMLIPDRTDFAVFEGSFDFLAALAHHGTDRPRSNVLVLNSLSFVERAREALKGRAATRLFMYLDNDQAGQDALKRFEEETSWAVRDMSSVYQGEKDMSAFLERLRGTTRDLGFDR
jgi:hypothetical protein